MFENKEQIAVLVKELDKIAYALHGFCVKAMEIFGEPPAPPGETPATPTVAETSSETAPADEVTSNEGTPPIALTKDSLHAALKAKAREGFSAQIKELLPKFGGTKVSEIPAENYADLLAAVEGLA